MNVEIIDFRATDGVLNTGYLVNGGNKKVLLATHGMSSNCFKDRERIISKELSKNGIDFYNIIWYTIFVKLFFGKGGAL